MIYGEKEIHGVAQKPVKRGETVYTDPRGPVAGSYVQ